MLPLKDLSFFCLLFVLFAHQINAVSISRISPTSGSIEGGTYLTIYGAGFAREGLEGETRAWLSNEICDVIEYYSSDTQLICVTRSYPTSTTHEVRVDTNGAFASQECSGGCYFKQTEYYTPTLDSMSSAGASNDAISFSGTLHSTYLAGYTVKVDDVWCSMEEEINDDEPFNSKQERHCRLGEQAAGHYNVSVSISPDYTANGLATLERSVIRVNKNGQSYSYSHYPQITAISSGSSGLQGGAVLTISGSGFAQDSESILTSLEDTESVEVKIGTLSCSVLSVTSSMITCTLPASSVSTDSSSFLDINGGRGLRHNIWYGVSSLALLEALPTYPSTPDFSSQVLDDFSGVTEHDNNYSEELTGYFIPPYTAEYIFYVKGDDSCYLEISSDDSFSNLVTVAYNLYYSSTYFNSESQISESIPLVAGLRYAVRFRHFEGSGGDWSSVAIRVIDPPIEDDEGLENQRSHASISEIQRVSIDSIVVREQQLITISGVDSGEWFLRSGDSISDKLEFPVKESDIRDAVKAVVDCSSISVSSNHDESVGQYTWLVTFSCAQEDANTKRQLLAVENYDLISLWDGNNPLLDFSVTRLAEASTPVRGTFQIGYGASDDDNTTAWTEVLEYSASAWNVKEALEGLDTIDQVEVSSSGTSGDGRDFIITFRSPYGDVPELVIRNIDLSGANVTLESSTTLEGSTDFWLDPAPMDWFQQDTTIPSLSVSVNNFLAECAGDCGFSFDSSKTPFVSAVTPQTLSSGDILTISGRNLDGSLVRIELDETSNSTLHSIVSIGTASCTVLSVSETEIQCLVGHMEAGAHSVSVVVDPFGFAELGALVSDVTYSLSIDSISPVSGGTMGGTLLTVTGTGFAADVANSFVHVGGASCEVVSASFSRIVCITPSLADATTNAYVTVGDVDISAYDLTSGAFSTTVSALDVTIYVYPTPFNYDPSALATVTSVTPTILSAATPELITIQGTNFLQSYDNNRRKWREDLSATFEQTEETLNLQDTSSSRFTTVFESLTSDLNGLKPFVDQVFVRIGANRICDIVSVTTSAIVCNLPVASASSTPITPIVWMDTQGFADIDSNIQVHPQFDIISLSPTLGSLAGGTMLTVTGSGFTSSSGDPIGDLSITLTTSENQELPCVIVDVRSFNEAVCETGPLSESIALTEYTGTSAQVSALVATVSTECAGECTFDIHSDYTSVLTSLSFITNDSGISLQFGGLRLAGTFANVWLGHDHPTDHSTHHYSAIIDLDDPPTLAPSPSGSSVCEVTDHTDTTISCHMSSGVPFGQYSVKLQVDNGFAAFLENQIFEVEQILQVSSLSQSSGSLLGGSFVTITGQGFSYDVAEMRVSFGDIPADIIQTIPTQMLVLVPPAIEDDAEFVGDENIQVNVTVSYVSHDVLKVADCADLVSCQYTYRGDKSPILNQITPSTGSPGTVLTITGSGFGSTPSSQTNALFGALLTRGMGICVIDTTSWSDTRLECTVGDVPAGSHVLRLSVGTKGYASTNTPDSATFTVALSISGVSPVQGSYGGGTLITVTGEGFGLLEAHSQLSLCGARCVVTESSYSQVICATPQAATPSALSSFQHMDPRVLYGTPIGDNLDAHADSVAFDGQKDDWVSGSQYGAWVGADFGEQGRAWVTRIRFFPRLRYASRMVGGLFQGSLDGTTWSFLAEVSSTPHEGWNYIDIADADVTAYNLNFGLRYFRYVSPDGGYCNVNEIEIIGVPLVASDGDEGVCTLNAQINPHAMTGDLHGSDSDALVTNFDFRYLVADTPTVTNISPTSGSSLGGTSVTLTGTGFLSGQVSMHSVYLNGIECTVDSVPSTSELICTTGARTLDEIYATSLSVYVENIGDALSDDTVRFHYLDRWSSSNTWLSDDVPVEGDTVVIPRGQYILLDVSPPQIFLLLIEGTLVFDRQDLELDATYIFVKGGTLQIGTEDEPFLQEATITLHGDRWDTIHIPHIGAKVLAVSDRDFTNHVHGDGGDLSTHSTHMTDMMAQDEEDDHFGNGMDDEYGRLDIHGQPRLRSWVKLGDLAMSGDTRLVLADEVDFVVGEQLIVTSSSRSLYEIEEVEVAAVISATEIELTNPLKFNHRADVYHFEGRIVDMRCEVALLSRNVRIQGDESSSSQLFGAHTISAHGGIYRIENAELSQCGQSGVLGRYCTHMHMAGEMEESYIRDNSIHHSFQRAVTIHGTHYTTVAHNVAYNVRGHTYFVEDGNEQYNLFDENLAALTKKHNAMLASDMKPANFWTSSPTNFWRHNVAAGSQMFGFWFELPGHPGGPSFTTEICPSSARLGAFYNNTAHSSSSHGLRIYPIYVPVSEPCGSEPEAQYFQDLTSFRNGGNGIFNRQVGDVHHQNSNLLENGGDEIFWKEHTNVNYGHDPNIYNLLAVGNTYLDPNYGPKYNGAIFSPQDEFFFVEKAIFVNYAGGVLKGCADCDSDTSFKQGGYTVRFKDLRFENAPHRTTWTAPYKQIFHDLDGSLTGFVNGTTTPFYGFNDWSSYCSQADSTYDEGLVCNGDVRIRRLQINAVEPRELDWKLLQIDSAAGTDRISMRPKEIYGWVLPIVTTHRYRMNWYSLIDFQSFRMRYSEPEYLEDDAEEMRRQGQLRGYGEGVSAEWMSFEYNYTDQRYQYQVQDHETSSIINWLDGHRVPEPSDPIGTGYMDVTTNSSWHLMINTFNASETSSDPYNIDVYALQCHPDGCVAPNPYNDQRNWSYWSDPTSWPSGQVPMEGEDVEIPSHQHIVLDVSPPNVRKLTISGVLSFEDTRDLTLSCMNILVWGELIIGSKEEPFQHDAIIELRGTRVSPTLVVDNTLFLGNKVLAILGSLSLYGRPVNQSWVRLEQTVNAGDDQLVLTEPVWGWRVNDTLVISPTDYDAQELEEVVIKGFSLDRKTILLNAALAHTHFGGSISTDTNSFTRGAAVGILDRNIKIQGQLLSDTDYYGGHIVVSEISSSDYHGTSTMNSVQLKHMGQFQMEHSAILYKYFSPSQNDPTNPHTPVTLTPSSAENSMVGCSVSYTYNEAINGEGVNNLYLEDNLVHRSFGHSIYLDELSFDAVLRHNLVVSTQQAPEYDQYTVHEWVVPIASYYLINQPGVMVENVAAGSEDAGFVYAPEACTSESTIYGNEAHGCMVGVWLLPTNNWCSQANDWIIWKSAHLGMFTLDQSSNIVIDGLVVSDSHIGLSLNFISGRKDHETVIRNSYIMGSTDASSCDTALTCRAMSKTDLTGEACNSVFGDAYRRIGFLYPQYLNRAKTCDQDGGLETCRPITTPERLCSLPWEKRYGLPSLVSARVSFENTEFAHFEVDDCGMQSLAFSLNPSQIDYAPPITLDSSCRWDSTVEAGAKMWLASIDGLTDSRCLGSCDATNFVLVRQLANNQILLGADNPPLAMGAPSCVVDNNIGAYICDENAYSPRLATVESMDSDSGGRNIGPVYLIRDDLGDSKTFWSVGPFKDMCAKRMPFGQFPFALESGVHYQMNFSSTAPSHVRFHYHSQDEDDKVLLSMFRQTPTALEVFVDGVLVEASTIVPTIEDADGTNALHPQNRQHYLVITGSPNSKRYDIIATPMIQVTLTLAMSLDVFFGDDLINNLALLLEIPSDRIKIASVHAGSVVVDMVVIAEQSANAYNNINATEAEYVESTFSNTSDYGSFTDTTAEVLHETQIKDLNLMVTNLTSMIITGAVSESLGFEVVGATIVAATISGNETEVLNLIDSSSSSSDSNDTISEEMTYAIYAGAIFVALLMVGACYRYCKRQKERDEAIIQTHIKVSAPIPDSSQSADANEALFVHQQTPNRDNKPLLFVDTSSSCNNTPRSSPTMSVSMLKNAPPETPSDIILHANDFARTPSSGIVLGPHPQMKYLVPETGPPFICDQCGFQFVWICHEDTHACPKCPGTCHLVREGSSTSSDDAQTNLPNFAHV